MRRRCRADRAGGARGRRCRPVLRERRDARRQHHLGPGTHLARCADRRDPPRRLRRRARHPRAGARAAPARIARRAVAPVRRRLLHDADDDARDAALRGVTRRARARHEAIARLGRLGADAAGAVVVGRTVLPGRLAQPAQRLHRRRRPGRARHRRHLRREHRRRVRSRRPVRPRGLLRFADDVRQLPARRPLAADEGAPPRGRGARRRAVGAARHRAALERRRLDRARRARRAATGRPRAGRARRRLCGRWRIAARPHTGRRIAAERRIAAGRQAARRDAGGRQPQHRRAGRDAGRAQRQQHPKKSGSCPTARSPTCRATTRCCRTACSRTASSTPTG
jgi:hypothetical protein